MKPNLVRVACTYSGVYYQSSAHRLNIMRGIDTGRDSGSWPLRQRYCFALSTVRDRGCTVLESYCSSYTWTASEYRGSRAIL
ncbi:hypothetical protein BJX99DRAFT_173997 [Aspergillus californicus]